MHKIELPASTLERSRSLRPSGPIDPKRTAAIVIDLQNFFLEPGQPMANPHGLDIIDNVNAVTAALRRGGGLVVFTQQSFAPVENDTRRRAPRTPPAPMMRDLMDKLKPGDPSFDLHARVAVAPQDLVITKRRPSAFHPYALTDLEETLSARGIETVIIMGVVTNGCCECTARDAYQLNYRVVFVSDANATFTDEEHNAALFNLALLFADVRDAASAVALIEGGEQAAA